MKSERILALDIIRGFFILVILVDHIWLFPSIYEIFTGRGALWVSAAEGFFMVSGLLVGYIYRSIIKKSFSKVLIKLWKRSGLLYLLSLVFTVMFVMWGNLVYPSPYLRNGLWVEPNLWEFIYKITTLQYFYGWTDFLQYYAVLMFFAPLALYLCYKKLFWLVPVISIGVWIFRGQNYYMSIQLIFMLSLVAGYYLTAIENWYKTKLHKKYKNPLLWGLVAIALATLILSILTVNISSYLLRYPHRTDLLPDIAKQAVYQLDAFHNFTRPYADKWTLEPLRLVMSLVWISALYILVRKYESKIEKTTKGLLSFFGKYSLSAYCLHGLIVFGMAFIIQNGRNIFVNSAMTTIILIGFYFAVRMWVKLVKAT